MGANHRFGFVPTTRLLACCLIALFVAACDDGDESCEPPEDFDYSSVEPSALESLIETGSPEAQPLAAAVMTEAERCTDAGATQLAYDQAAALCDFLDKQNLLKNPRTGKVCHGRLAQTICKAKMAKIFKDNICNGCPDGCK